MIAPSSPIRIRSTGVSGLYAGLCRRPGHGRIRIGHAVTSAALGDIEVVGKKGVR